MFHALGRFVGRRKGWVILAWLLAALLVTWLAPNLADVSAANEFVLLPEDVPSQQAQRLLEAEFPQLAGVGEGILVLYNPQGLTAADEAYARRLIDWLRSDEAPPVVGQVLSPFEQEGAAAFFRSPDGTTLLIPIDFTTDPYNDATNQAIDAIRAHIAQVRPADLEVYLTGQSPIGRDLFATMLEAIDRTTVATLVLVILVLLLIYRAPIAAGIPLVSIGLAFLVARGLLAWLAQAGMSVTTETEAFLVVLIFGAGTDYALFLISRYREELARQGDGDPLAADAETLRRVGPVITASGGTVIFGTLAMAAGRFEMVRSRGPALALGVAIALVASLTLTPALLALFGRRLFWPFHRRVDNGEEVEHRSRFWERIADAVAARPGWAALGITLLLLAPYLALPRMVRTFDILGELPSETEARKGFETIQAHFGAGEMMPIAVVLQGEEDWRTPEGLRQLAGLHEELAALEGVAEVRSLVRPGGARLSEADRLLRAPEQLRFLADGLRDSALNPATDPEALAAALAEAEAGLEALRAYLAQLGEAYPALKEEAAWATAQQALEALGTDLAGTRTALQVSTQLKTLAALLEAWELQATDPSALVGHGAQAPDQNLGLLKGYLEALAEAYPEVREDPAYLQTVDALEDLDAALTEFARQAQVSVQLQGFAEQIGAAAAQLRTNPLALKGSAEGMEVLGTYLQELARAYPEVRGNPDYQGALEALGRLEAQMALLTGPEAAAATPEQKAQALQEVEAALKALAERLAALATAFADRDAPFFPESLADLPQARAARQELAATLERLRTGVEGLARTFEGRDAPFLPPPELAAAFSKGEGSFDPAALQRRQATLAGALDALAEALPPDAYLLPTALADRVPGLADFLSTYVSEDGRVTQIQVLTEYEPYSEEARTLVETLDRAVEAYAAPLGARAYVGGVAAQVRDVRALVDGDFRRVAPVVIGTVFLILVLLLGSLIAPIYLVATVLLSYGTTLGLAVLLFQELLGYGAVNYTLNLVLLVLLVALGADYNIFLISRVWEETEARGDLREGVRHASAYTGGVITSAGIILAGTFAALAVAPMRSLVEMGVTVAMGVLLDTFIVRGMLVPALAARVGRWNWWPAPHPLGHGGFLRLLALWLRDRRS